MHIYNVGNEQQARWLLQFRDIVSPHQHEQLNIMVEWLTLLLRILELPDSNLGPETSHPDGGFSWLSQSLQANSGIVN
jgi:hypothetical protein